MKTLSYRPDGIKIVEIPKGNGQFRTLGISNIEDKIVQLMFSKLLSAIYEPMFYKCSYGFRRNKSAHEAIRETVNYLQFNNVKQVLDIDLANYFGTIHHEKLLGFLSQRIEDKVFLRYISRMQKSMDRSVDGIKRAEIGLVQGSILSPVLANIYAHYVIDQWFMEAVPTHTIGKTKLVRFCDDMVVCCTDTRDTNKIVRSFQKRLQKFGLQLNREKTRTVKFNRYQYERNIKQETFDFLGFTFYLSKAIKGGFTAIKVKTSKKTLRAKLANVKLWIQRNRSAGGLRDVWVKFCQKLKGHIAYFGVTNNGRSVEKFLHTARRIFFKWMNRRSQKRSFNWGQFKVFEKQYPAPRCKIYHQIY